MSDTTSLKAKRRPPKLSPIIPEVKVEHEAQDVLNSGNATSNSAKCDLDSTVEITIGDEGKTILINPNDLTVLEQLGRGQYGIVERVSHNKSGCQFAIKRVALRQDDDNEKRRLLMDVDILVKGTECKNIIKFYGALIWEGDLWILMELMDCSLDKFYKLAHKNASQPGVKLQSINDTCSHNDTQIGNCDQCNPIPEKVLGRIAGDIVNALSYLYSIKVIHRDIKPSNILINRMGVIKLCDFGISGYLVNSVARTYEAGCRPYMAPERIDPPRDRTGYDIKSDVWSFGITMLEIATGRYPYQHASNFFEQLKRICADEPPKLPDGKFSHEFRDFICLCLKKDYQSRPKFNILENHPFIAMNKANDISYFTQRFLKEEFVTI